MQFHCNCGAQARFDLEPVPHKRQLVAAVHSIELLKEGQFEALAKVNASYCAQVGSGYVAKGGREASEKEGGTELVGFN